MSEPIRTQVVVVGAGPGGYSAAFRAADLGLYLGQQGLFPLQPPKLPGAERHEDGDPAKAEDQGKDYAAHLDLKTKARGFPRACQSVREGRAYWPQT